MNTSLAREAAAVTDPRTSSYGFAADAAAPQTSGSRRRVAQYTLLLADVGGLAGAFLGTLMVVGARDPTGGSRTTTQHLVLFAIVLPLWALGATVLGLHRRASYCADQSIVDDAAGIFYFVTTSTWILIVVGFVTSTDPDLHLVATFWAIALVAVTAAHALARAAIGHNLRYLQNTLIVGAGDVGQLVARKLTRHPEYGLRVVGLVDDAPKCRRSDLDTLRIVGSPTELRSLVRSLGVDRVIVAFSNDSTEATLRIVHDLADLDVQIDVVPRLFEVLPPNVLMHRIEGLPLTSVPPARRSRSSFLVKRVIDIVVSTVALLLVSPLMAYIAWRIKRESPGPVLFRQTRLGLNMREFTVLKFRTMKIDTDEDEHRRYICQSMRFDSAANSTGLFKLDRRDALTSFGSWLRKTSLDELPQLLNVLHGEMSLVGPRPCIPYETQIFKRHHFERFRVPAGITGLWQVTARANSTFDEALEMDVAYVRGWSLGLDLRILFETPFQILRQRGATL